MRPRTTAFCAVSVDGFLAREDGSVDWLERTTGTDEGDYGYGALLDSVDLLVMGRKTLDTVRGFDAWPYEVPVVVLSRTLREVPASLTDRVRVRAGEPAALLDRARGGGARLRRRRPGDPGVPRGGGRRRARPHEDPDPPRAGIPLFGRLDRDMALRHVETRAYPSGLVQTRYAIDP